ncbi:hypothetical protein QR97_01985 [Streptomyces sp. PBH53]|uniref:recombinase family protein n=1 Tax=Streptomyces sp. PBH53 TaxID=1577075 RepID=UPI000655E07E|nr:recombinase family protein [Streptomyces sp. PBH53]AKN68736.1 hypothetical protein QR97_01985 [Streptomyces sp. PBH53]
MSARTLAQRITALLDDIPTVRLPGEPDHGPDDSWWGGVEQSRIPAHRQARLSRLCRSTLDTAVACPGSPYKVLLYTVVSAKDDPRPSLRVAEDYARRQGWRVVGQLVDDGPPDDQLWFREEWQRALKALRGGFVQGVVTADRSVVSRVDDSYEQTLHWFLDHFSFVAHVPPATPGRTRRAFHPQGVRAC